MVLGIGDMRVERGRLAEPGASAESQEKPVGWRRIGSVVMLAGSVRTHGLRKHTGRSIIEMPVTSSQSVLDCWSDELTTVANRYDLQRLRVRVMVSQIGHLPASSQPRGPLDLSIEQDPSTLRGTGGLLHDLAKQYPEDEYLLVVHGAQLLFTSLAQQVETIVRTRADIGIVCDQAGSPGGVMLIRCGCLRQINAVGFVDLNEQALPAIATRHDVRVVRVGDRPSMSIRTRRHYLAALRRFHRIQAGRISDDTAFEEDWRPTFGLIEAGAAVHEQAVVHDSVVLGGARVEAGAVLIRSVVCPGAVVGKGQRVADQMIGGPVRGI